MDLPAYKHVERFSVRYLAQIIRANSIVNWSRTTWHILFANNLLPGQTVLQRSVKTEYLAFCIVQPRQWDVFVPGVHRGRKRYCRISVAKGSNEAAATARKASQMEIHLVLLPGWETSNVSSLRRLPDPMLDTKFLNIFYNLENLFAYWVVAGHLQKLED